MILLRNQDLISAKESEHYFVHLYQKAKTPDYYHKTRRGLGYVFTTVSSDSESEEEVYHDSSLAASSWDIMMHNVNIEETNLETSVLSLPLFS